MFKITSNIYNGIIELMRALKNHENSGFSWVLCVQKLFYPQSYGSFLFYFLPIFHFKKSQKFYFENFNHKIFRNTEGKITKFRSFGCILKRNILAKFG